MQKSITKEGKVILASTESKEVQTHHILDMVKSILSACIQKGADSVSKEEIKQFYHSNNFDECFKETSSYLSTHSFKNLEESITYSFDLKRKLFDGTICSGYGIQTAIKKSDR